MNVSVKIDMETCILCGVCQAAFPGAFIQTSVVECNLDEAVQDLPRLEATRRMCPMDSIRVEVT